MTKIHNNNYEKNLYSTIEKEIEGREMEKRIVVTIILIMVITGIVLLALLGLWKHTINTNPYYNTLSSEQRQQIKTSNSEQVIQMYYNAINAGNYELALAILSPRQLRYFCGLTFKEFLTHKFRDALEEELAYIKSLSGKISNISINYIERPTALPPLPPGAVQAEAHIDYSGNIQEPDLLFITLVKSPYDSHWQINGFGTCP